ncbi:hypothetical protein M433DRAFT_56814 [Acidomyces richmondensis BFW]|nr:MAG: hypothetical protein FE78DRAFT_148712 [Acidomyces sp. 'richmondensis']KYG50571.1 hypothetical protein M433DRAFT_56814 [Acidomyces richmondensis BFW]
MPSGSFTAADTIRILVASDNHVGYNERDPIRGDDSWKSFHEVMCLAKKHDVDMVLLAGDLFHENKPSRKSMYQVMRSIRMNCYGDKPCELEMLSDASEQFPGTFNHVNYEDPDINVAIPVFSIHGNHDDPSGEGHYAALDLLQVSGLVNYYGRTPESDNIQVKPVLLQKGKTKLALYGMSNVRDERLFRTFRDGNVKFFQPATQKDDWFNIMSVHQNRHAHTETGYLPENFLPDFMDLIIWGHEHECLIDPHTNPETGFRVIQPGSSVATSLVEGETAAKHVAIVSVQGRTFDIQPIRLQTVRPFVMREITLADSREMRNLAHDDDNRPKITRYLMGIVDELIEEANEQWRTSRREARREAGEDEEDDDNVIPPAPIIRLRVEYTAPDGGNFDCENPQRFSNRFLGRVANVNDVVQFHRKRQAQKMIRGKAEMPEESIMAQLQIDSIKIEKLVNEFLTAQSLTILPQNNFSDAVGQFVNKDDLGAMKHFVDESLKTQVQELIGEDEEDNEVDEDHITEMMEDIKVKLEQKFAKGELKYNQRSGPRKEKPHYWDSDIDGHWEDNPASLMVYDDGDIDREEEDMESIVSVPKSKSARGGRGRGGAAAKGTTRKMPTATKKVPTIGKGRKQQVPDEDDDDDDDDSDIIMLDGDNNNHDDSVLFINSDFKKASERNPPARSKQHKVPGRQTTLAFSTQTDQVNARLNGSRRAAASNAASKMVEPSEDEISDDDAFEPPPSTARSRMRR